MQSRSFRYFLVGKTVPGSAARAEATSLKLYQRAIPTPNNTTPKATTNKRRHQPIDPREDCVQGGLQQMHRSDQQLSEGFESNQTIIEQGPHCTATSFSLRPTDYAPRAILRTHLHKKLPEAIDHPYQQCQEAPIKSTLSPRGRREEGRSSSTPSQAYQCNREEFRLVYFRRDGERVFDTQEDFSARTLPLKHLLRYHEQNYTLLRPHESPPAFHNCSGFLNFDSRFECGNLLCAYQSLSSPVEYHLFMENDTNRFGYNQWFYFSLAGALPGNTYRFKVLNFRKPTSFYKSGMRPATFSLKEHQKSGNGWSRDAYNVTYGPSTVHDIFEGTQCRLYCLSFDMQFKHAQDFITVSSGLPYSYSRLIKQLKECKAIGQANGLQWTQRTIAYTLGNNQVPYLIIRKAEDQSVATTSASVSSCPSKQICHKSRKKKLPPPKREEGKPIILMMARQHPGETHSSFLMESFLKQLASTTKQSKNLLQQYEFHIFPMVNVDGVIYGNFRCDLAGFDLNRAWRTPLREMHPQVQAITDKVRHLSQGQRVAFCFDLHSHSKQYGVFSYCCKEDQVQSRVFPLLASQNSPLFLFPCCTFGLSRDKFATARAVISHIIKNPLVLTVEASSYAVKQGGTVSVLQPYHFDCLATAVLRTLVQYASNGAAKQEAEREVKARIVEFQAYQRHNEEISGSDSECEIDPQQHLKQLRSILPENTIKKLQRKCAQIEIDKKPSSSNKSTLKQPLRTMPDVPQTISAPIQRVQPRQVRRFYPKTQTRKQQVLAILRTKDGLRQQAVPKKLEEQPIIRMPIGSFKLNMARLEHTKTENPTQKQDYFLTEEESKLLQHPKPAKNRSSLILGSAHREALKIGPKKQEPSHFKQKSGDEEEDEIFQRVGDRRNTRRMSKVEKILRLRKRANTLKNIHCQQRPPCASSILEMKIGQTKQDKLDIPFRDSSVPARLKLNKSSTAINRPAVLQREKVVRMPQRAAVTNHPNAQNSLIGQLWRINYGRYSKELS